MTARYLLDTNAISHAVRHPNGPVAMRIVDHGDSVVTSVIVESEIRFGLARQVGGRVAARVGRFLDSISILPFDSDAAMHYGNIRSQLEALGTPIDAMDTLIAAHARSRRSCLVTDNVSHFQRVPGLDWENWQA